MVTLTAVDPGDLKATLKRIVKSASDHFSADVCTMIAVDPVTRWLVGEPIVVGDLSEEGNKVIKEPRGGALTRWIAAEGRLFVDDLSEEKAFESDFTILENIQSFAAIALRTPQQKTLAVLYVGFRKVHRFTQSEQELLTEFAKEASVVLHSSWLLDRYRAVVEIGQEINQGLEGVDDLFKKLSEKIGERLLELSYLVLGVHDIQADLLTLYIKKAEQIVVIENASMERACGWVVRNKKSITIDDLSTAKELPTPLIDIQGTDAPEPDPRSLIFLPLIFHDSCVGVLSVQHIDANSFDTEDQYILGLLANQIALALHNVRLFESLTRLIAVSQNLTQQLNSKRVPIDIVQWILQATRADVVILFSYVQETNDFEIPPHVAGKLMDTEYGKVDIIRSDDIARLALSKAAPTFEADSKALFEKLGGNSATRAGSFEVREEIKSTVVAPLRVYDEIVGVLFINFRQPQHFDATQTHLIEGLANYAAIAIKNSREFGAEASRHVRELKLLRSIDREISKTLNLQEILQTILELATSHVAADEASILLDNPRTLQLETKAAIGKNVEISLKQSISLQGPNGITCWAYRNRKPARVDDVHSDEWRNIYLEISPGMVSELDVPLIDGDEVIGVISFESRKPAAYTEEAEDFIVTLAERAVLAIKNAQIYERAQQIADELLALEEVGREIVSELNVKEVHETILGRALTLTQSEAGQIILLDDRRGDLYTATQRGASLAEPDSRLPLDKGITGWVVRHNELVNADLLEPRWKTIHEPMIPNARWELCVPLKEGDRACGAINIERAGEFPFTIQDEFRLGKLADLAVIAKQNAERYERAEEGRRRLQALHEIDKQIVGQLGNPDKAIQIVLENALRLTIADTAELHLREDIRVEDTQFITFDKIYLIRKHEKGGLLQVEWPERDGKIDRGIVKRVAETEKPYRTRGDAQQDSYYKGDPDIHSELAVPLFAGGSRLIGVFNLESQREDAFDNDDEWLLELFAHQALIAIQNAEAYHKAQQEEKRFGLLAEAGHRLSQITNVERIEDAYEIIIDIFKRHCEGQVLIRRYEEKTQELVLVRVGLQRDVLPTDRLKIAQGVSGQVFRERHTIVVPDIDSPPQGVATPHRSFFKTRSLVVTPIQLPFRGRYYGNFSLSHEKPNYFKVTDIELIEGLADQLANTLYPLEVVEELQKAEQRATAAEAMSSMGTMTAELAHRVTSYIGTVPTQVKLISNKLEKNGVNDNRIEQTFKSISENVEKLKAYSGSLAKYAAEFQEGSMKDRQSFVLKKLLSDAYKSFPIPPANIQIEMPKPDDLKHLANVYVVPRQIRDILCELVNNAIGAMPDGGRVIIQLRDANQDIEVRVADTGAGIPAEIQGRIFDPLFTTKKEGTGFGLWISRSFAKLNGGDLKVVSAPSHGATFILTLPKA